MQFSCAPIHTYLVLCLPRSRTHCTRRFHLRPITAALSFQTAQRPPPSPPRSRGAHCSRYIDIYIHASRLSPLSLSPVTCINIDALESSTRATRIHTLARQPVVPCCALRGSLPPLSCVPFEILIALNCTFACGPLQAADKYLLTASNLVCACVVL